MALSRRDLLTLGSLTLAGGTFAPTYAGQNTGDSGEKPMADRYFDPVLFIGDGDCVTVDTKQTPYLYNQDGRGRHVPNPIGKLIPPAPERPDLRMGMCYPNVRHWTKKIPNKDGSTYEITEFDFGAGKVRYEGLWATFETAQAFGMTLLRSGESIQFVHDALVASCQYTYGAFAGYQSPYIDIPRRGRLLTVNATDLEYHPFPHAFCSQDTLPLVVSVARYRPAEAAIWLADLWVRQGDCLYLPPKYPRADYIDMHGNRNSARACWGQDAKDSLVTQTSLDTKLPGVQYHEERHPTVHGVPSS